jgi:hypothetical protein
MVTKRQFCFCYGQEPLAVDSVLNKAEVWLTGLGFEPTTYGVWGSSPSLPLAFFPATSSAHWMRNAGINNPKRIWQNCDLIGIFVLTERQKFATLR